MLTATAVSLFFLLLCHLTNCLVDNDIMIQYNELISKTDPKRWMAFYPGTLWCGPGNLTESYDQLGVEMEADKCCRAHDSCPDYIGAGETKYNLKNYDIFTKYSCECDDMLRECFRAVGNPMADYLGKEYFNQAAQCFRKDYPVIECTKRHMMSPLWNSGNSRCVEYSYDTNGVKCYQWFDLLPYSYN